jgi:hypothetical protein
MQAIKDAICGVGESGKKLGVYPFEFTENLDSKNKNAGRE